MDESHETALDSGPLTLRETRALQAELYSLLAERTARYTAGESSSVPAVTAKELLRSIRFTLGLAPDAEPARLRELLRAGLRTKFERGIRAVEEKTVRGRELWRAACLTCPPIENQALRDTLQSIGGFWRRYDHRFLAHDIPCDIDYPLCHPVPETLLGVDYINGYLRRLLIENAFLRKLVPHSAVRVLKSACPDYRGLLINLYEPLAVNAIGLMLIGKSPMKLSVSPSERAQIEALLFPLPREDMAKRLRRAAQALCQRLRLQREAQNYLVALSETLAPRIRAALPDLAGVFLTGR